MSKTFKPDNRGLWIGEFSFYIDPFGNYHSLPIEALSNTVEKIYRLNRLDIYQFHMEILSKVLFLKRRKQGESTNESAVSFYFSNCIDVPFQIYNTLLQSYNTIIDPTKPSPTSKKFQLQGYPIPSDPFNICKDYGIPCGNAREAFEYYLGKNEKPRRIELANQYGFSLSILNPLFEEEKLESIPQARTLLSQRDTSIDQQNAAPKTPFELSIVFLKNMFLSSNKPEVRAYLSQCIERMNQEDIQNKERCAIIIKEREQFLKEHFEQIDQHPLTTGSPFQNIMKYYPKTLDVYNAFLKRMREVARNVFVSNDDIDDEIEILGGD